MSESAARAALAAEFDILARALLGRPPDASWGGTYIRAHEAGTVQTGPATALDRALLALAGAGPAFARLADAFAALFSRAGLLRRKFVLVLAILESHAASATVIDTARSGSLAGWILLAASQGLLWIFRFLAAVILVPPLWIFFRATAPSGGAL